VPFTLALRVLAPNDHQAVLGPVYRPRMAVEVGADDVRAILTEEAEETWRRRSRLKTGFVPPPDVPRQFGGVEQRVAGEWKFLIRNFVMLIC